MEAGPKILDLRGEFCPYTFILTMAELEDLPDGARLVVYLDCGQPIRDVPRGLADVGHAVLSVEPLAPDGKAFKVLVEKNGLRKDERHD